MEPVIPSDLAQPRVTPLQEEIKAREQGIQRPTPSVLETLGGTFINDTTIGVAVDALDNAFVAPTFDPGFGATLEDNFDALMEGVPDEHRPALADAGSLVEFTRRKERLLAALQFDADVVRGGAGTIATRLAGNFLEPTAAVSAPILGSIRALNRGSRLARALKTGAATGAETAAVEAFLAANTDHITEEDVLIAGLVGLTVGGGIGGLLPGEAVRASNAAVRGVRRAVDQEVQKATQPVQDARFRAGSPENEERLRQLRARTGKPNVTPKVRPVRDEAAGAEADSVGAARAGPAEGGPPLRDDAQFLTRLGRDPDEPLQESEEVAKSAFASGRFDIAGILGRDDDEAVRAFAKQLVEDPVEGNPGPAASELQTFFHRKLLAVSRRASEPAFQAWARERGRARLRWNPRSFRARNEFFREVGRHVRTGQSPDKNVQQAADGFRAMFRETLKELKRAGVRGFEDIPDNANFVPRIRDDAAIARHLSRFGPDQIEELIARSMRSAAPDIDERLLNRIAKGYWRRLQRLSFGADMAIAHGVDLQDLETVRAILREGGNVSDDEVEQIVNQLRQSQNRDSRGGGSRSRRRADIDESFTMRLVDRDTGEEVDVAILDLFENNVELLAQPYARSMAGWIGLADAANIRSEADIQDSIQAIVARSQEAGSARAEQVRKKVIPRLEFLFNYLRGLPTHQRGAFDDILSLVRDYNFTRVMNQAGFAQIAEIGNVLAFAGWKAALQRMPSLRQFSRDAVTGRLKLDDARIIEEIFSLGNERLVGSIATRFEADEFDRPTGFGVVGDAITAGRNITADFGGLAPMTAMLQQWAAGGVIQRFMDVAAGTTADFNPRRLQLMGLGPDKWDAVKAGLRKHTTRPSARGLRAVDWEAWQAEDPAVFNTFRMAVFRVGRRAIQENDVGATDVWMHSTFGRILTQFRSFLMGSYSKQLLSGLATRDIIAWQGMMLTTVFAGVGYTARTYINHWNEPDKLEERLDPFRIAGQSIYGSSALGSAAVMASWMIQAPGLDGFLPDEVQKLMDIERSTNLATDALFGNPTADVAQRAFELVPGLTEAAIDGRSITQQDFRNIRALLPVLNNLSGVRNVHNVIANDLPRADRFN